MLSSYGGMVATIDTSDLNISFDISISSYVLGMDPVVFVVVGIEWRVGPGIHGDIKTIRAELGEI
jgi:hypothetical protein